MFIYLKLLVLFAIILFFSTFISSILSIVLTMLVYIISHSLTSIIDMAVHAKSMALLNMGKLCYIIFPNFEALNIKNTIMSTVSIGFEYIALNMLYAVIYLVLILGFTIIIFNRKTFES